MSSDAVAKSVARKLRYYMQVQRLEEGFDLTGPEIPRRDYVAVKPAPLYSGAALHDKPVKKYFKNDEIRCQLQSLSANPAAKKLKRRKNVKRNIESAMAQCEFRDPVDNTPFGSRPRKLAYKSNINRPAPVSAFASGISTLRRAPPVGISTNEAQRIVKTAARLIVATETVALNVGKQNRENKFFKDRNEKSSELPFISKRKHSSQKNVDHESESEEENIETVVSKVGKMNYKVQITTGSTGLQRKTRVKMRLISDNGSSKWIKMEPSEPKRRHFMSNQEDVFNLSCDAIGSLTSIQLGHDNVRNDKHWSVKKVVLTDEGMGDSYLFDSSSIKRKYSSNNNAAVIILPLVKKLSNDYESSLESSSSLSSLSIKSTDGTSVATDQTKSLSKKDEPMKSEEEKYISDSSNSSLSSSISSSSLSSEPDNEPKRTNNMYSNDEGSSSDSEINESPRLMKMNERSLLSSGSESSSDVEEENKKKTVMLLPPLPPDTASSQGTFADDDISSDEESASVTETQDVTAATETDFNESKADIGESQETTMQTESQDQESLLKSRVSSSESEEEQQKEEQSESAEAHTSVEEQASKDELTKEEAKDSETESNQNAQEESKLTPLQRSVSNESQSENLTNKEEESSILPAETTQESEINKEKEEPTNLIKNSLFSDLTRYPCEWLQYGGSLIHVEEVNSEEIAYACSVKERSAIFAGVAQNMTGYILPGEKYRITAYFKIVTASTDEHIRCVFHYRIQGQRKVQLLRISELRISSESDWMLLIGFVDVDRICPNNNDFEFIRLCFEGPNKGIDFMVANVSVNHINPANENEQNIIRNSNFQEFNFMPASWKGVAQASFKLGDETYNGIPCCVTTDRPHDYSGIGQNILDVVVPGHSYEFSCAVKLLINGPCVVTAILKFCAKEGSGDSSYRIAQIDEASSENWDILKGTINTGELIPESERFEYCSFHIEAPALVHFMISDCQLFDVTSNQEAKERSEVIQRPGFGITQPTSDSSVESKDINQQIDQNLKVEREDSDSSRSSLSKSSYSSQSSSSSQSEDDAQKKSIIDRQLTTPPFVDEPSVSEDDVQYCNKDYPVDSTFPYQPFNIKVPSPQTPSESDIRDLSQLHEAIQRGNTEEVKIILNKKPYLINMPEKRTGDTTLHVAAAHNQHKLVRQLSKSGAEKLRISKSGLMPFHRAALNNDTETMAVLLTLGVSINTVSEGDKQTALHLAARQGHLLAVRWLIVNGAILNLKDNIQRTPSDIASLYGHYDIVKLLDISIKSLREGNDVLEVVKSFKGNDAKMSPSKSTPLASLNSDEEEMLRQFFKAVEDGDLNEIGTIAKEYPHIINLPNKAGITAVHLATDKGNSSALGKLADVGGDLSLASSSGFLPLHRAAFNGDIEILSTLQERGVSLNEMSPSQQTALHVAAQRGNEKVIYWLIRNGAILNHKDGMKRTPAEVANSYGNTELSQLLNKCVECLKRNEDVVHLLPQ